MFVSVGVGSCVEFRTMNLFSLRHFSFSTQLHHLYYSAHCLFYHISYWHMLNICHYYVYSHFCYKDLY